MIRRPPRSTLFPTRRSSDLHNRVRVPCSRALKTPQYKTSTAPRLLDRKSTRLNSSHGYISYAVFCLKKKNEVTTPRSGASPTATPPPDTTHTCATSL